MPMRQESRTGRMRPASMDPTSSQVDLEQAFFDLYRDSAATLHDSRRTSYLRCEVNRLMDTPC